MAEIGINKWLRKIYQSMESGRARKLYLKADSIAQKYGGKLYCGTVKRLKHHVRDMAARQGGGAESGTLEDLCWEYEKEAGPTEVPLVSVILSVADCSIRLEECLECICNQSYPNIEVLILGYGLPEDRRKAIKEYSCSAPIRTTVLHGGLDAPSMLEQWNEGLRAAKSSCVWFPNGRCHYGRDFLQGAVSMFSYGSVMAVFAGSRQLLDIHDRDGEPLPYGPGIHGWKKPFFMTAHDAVRQGPASYGMVPSLGGAVFKNRRPIPSEVVEAYRGMRFCAPWIFTLHMIRGGVIGYTGVADTCDPPGLGKLLLGGEEAVLYYKEAEAVSGYIARHYKVGDGYYEQILQSLARQCGDGGVRDAEAAVRQCYCPDRIRLLEKERKPNVLMACYALRSGGGEVYPIHLSNELRRHGMAVTLVNFGIEEEEEGIRQLVDADVPVVTIKSRDYLKQIVARLGGEIIHSHCASVDGVIAQWRKYDRGLGHHVITLHGMYEAMEEEDCDRVIVDTWESGARYIYIADKNLECFQHRGYDIDDRFTKIPNGLPLVDVNPVRRETMGIPDNAFVLVTASRGIPEKGWQEAVLAVTAANERGSRPIHLVVVGEGEIRAKLERDAHPYIHFTGFRPNVRDYFAMADVGLVPTYFKGESYPLVVIECLMTGTPIIATDIAEVRNQLQDGNGDLAGILLPLHSGKVDEEDICAAILKLAEGAEDYIRLKGRVRGACRKFDMTAIVDRHMRLYQEVAAT